MRRPPESRTTEDILLLLVVGTLLFSVMTSLEVFGRLASWLHAQELIDDLVSFVLLAVAGFAIFSWRRWRELQGAQRDLRVLAGVIPICAWCRKARTETGGWMPLEDYVRKESDSDLSPDLCPECEARLPAPGTRRGFF